ncbi:hypothetical protein A2U01_0018179, partial [Trifolium medium]|nr:hypothetical protein [Trifolium medium]
MMHVLSNIIKCEEIESDLVTSGSRVDQDKVDTIGYIIVA